MPVGVIQKRIQRNGESGPGGNASPLPGGSRRLTLLGAALLVVAAAFAMRVALSGEFATPTFSAGKEAVETGAGLTEHLAMAKSAQEAGDVESALSHYRAAARLNPRIVDKAAPEFLGARFEETLRGWVGGLKRGRIRAGPHAMRDAAYLFRRMYGGCG